MKYRLIGGNHSQDGKIYVKGNIIETNRDLTAMFRGKFEEVHDKEAKDTGVDDVATRKPRIPVPDKEADKDIDKDVDVDEELDVNTDVDVDEADKEEVKDDPKLGKNITDKFPKAAEKEMSVWLQKGNWCIVTDDRDSDNVLTKKKLREKEIAAFLNTWE